MTVVWNAEDPRVPSREKRGSREGNLVSTLPFGVHRCVPWQQGREDLFPGSGKGLQQAKSSTTDWVGWGWVSNVIVPQARLREGPARSALSRTLMC